VSGDFGTGFLLGVLVLSVVWLFVNFMAERADALARATLASPVLRRPSAPMAPPTEPPRAGERTMDLLE
jgi:hypothetical protein